MNILEFKKLPMMGILRGVKPDEIELLIETAVSAGLKTLEITMNSGGAAELIHKAVSCAKKRLTIGAGTVLNLQDLKCALDAGATFIVTPVLIEEVITYCTQNKIPVFPGALTPSEIYAAWKAGATMVKVFPAKFFGPAYFKEIKGPFNDIQLLACSGVTPLNMQDYFANGASAITFGASVFRRDWLQNKNFKSIEESIKKYVLEFQRIKNFSN